MYHCAECKRPVAVLVENGRQVIVRGCQCKASIVADMTAAMAGKGGVQA